jgi:HK97 family phage prohead protease
MDFRFEIDSKAISDAGEFEGYASVFGIVDQGGDCVLPGAFIKSIAKAKADRRLIPMLWQHDRTRPIGTWTDMAEDSKGLYVKGQLLKDQVAAATEAYALLKASAIGGLSIGYRVLPGGAAEDPKRRGVFLLKDLDLIEVSLVTLPMLIQARVSSVKHLLEAGGTPTVREFEGFLREAGMPRSLATAISSKAAPLLRRDVEAEADGAASLAGALASRLKDFDFRENV